MPSSTMGVGNIWAIVKQFSDHFREFNIDTPIFKREMDDDRRF